MRGFESRRMHILFLRQKNMTLQVHIILPNEHNTYKAQHNIFLIFMLHKLCIGITEYGTVCHIHILPAACSGPGIALLCVLGCRSSYYSKILGFLVQVPAAGPSGTK